MPGKLPRIFEFRMLDVFIVLVPFALYLLMTWPLRDWLVDDAGVTFAYARNLAQGHGLVSQPGAPPVEGFSNPLWLFLMVPFFWFKLFHPYLVPKIISALLVLFSYGYIHRLLMKFTGGRELASFAVLVVLSLNTSFVAWTCSGLENALYVFLIVILFTISVKFLDRENSPGRLASLAGLIATGIALTRPDGLVYSAMFPLIIIVDRLGRVDKNIDRVTLGQLASYGAVWVVSYGGYILFRVLYFGQLLPNTAYAKGGPKISQVVSALFLQNDYLDKFQKLSQSVWGFKLWLVLPAVLLVMVTLWLAYDENRRRNFVLLLMTFWGYFVFMIMPNDWMGEYRFATPFFVFYLMLTGVLFSFVLTRYLRNSRYRTIVGIALVVVLAIVAVKVHYPRLETFYRGKLVAFERIAHLYPFKFNEYAEKLGIKEGSVLLPDVGATLYYSKLRVYDLVGLCDSTIARTVRKDKKRFYDYVFEDTKPTFIHTHGNWTLLAGFAGDPRFRRDYVPVREYPDKWIKEVASKDMMSGDYVRRDAVIGKEKILESLK
ncbi:MAG: hypothetical protein ACOYVF_09080 [Candidatus Zixiibacteriota bacterium]